MSKRKSFDCDQEFKAIIPGTGFYGVHAYNDGEPIIQEIICFAIVEKYIPRFDQYDSSIEPMQWGDGFIDTISTDEQFVGVFSADEIHEYRTNEDSPLKRIIAGFLEHKKRTEALKAQRASQ